MDRRRLLGLLGSLGTAGLAGCSGAPRQRTATDEATSTDNPTPGDNSTEERRRLEASGEPGPTATAWGLDDVAHFGELGADTDGERPIDDLLERHATDGTLVYLPPGEYLLEGTVAIGGDVRLGILGPDATIVPPTGADRTLLGLGYPEPLTALFVSGLTFDFCAENTGGRPMFGMADERVLMRDLSVRGVVDVEQDLFRLDVTSPNGTGLVERLHLPDGSTVRGVTGCEVGDKNLGDIVFRDCRIEGFPDNGLYADPPEGRVEVYGGFFRNNGVAGIRIETSEPSIVRGAHVRCDDADATGENMRGIRLRSGRSLLVEDCLVELVELPSSDGAVVISAETKSATVRNCRLRVDADGVNGIRVKEPNQGAGAAVRQGPFRFEDVTITGNASGGAAVRASGRENCSFQNLHILQPGDNRDGIYTTNVRGELVNSCISVTDEPLALSKSVLDRHNVWLDTDPAGGCCWSDCSGSHPNQN